MTNNEEKAFLADVLKVSYEGTNNDLSGDVRGLGTTFKFHRQLNEKHYAALKSDILMPTTNNAFSTMVYNNQTCAAVAYQGNDYRTFTIGFPFECITDKTLQESIMRGILKFLISR
jgi:hypothetical protein